MGVGKRSFRRVLAKTWVEEVSLETIIRLKFVILKRTEVGTWNYIGDWILT